MPVWLVNGFGEEIRWRGTMAEDLLHRHGVRRTGLFVAAAWAEWHLPLSWVAQSFRGFGPAGVVGWLLGPTLGSVLLTWL